MTYILITMNIIIFVISVKKPALIGQYGLSPAGITAHHEYYRLATYMFLHGSLMHVFMNMSGLYALGNVLEQHLGSLKFLFIYIGIGVMTGLTSILMRNAVGSRDIVSIGASGALYGLFGILVGQMIKTVGIREALSHNRTTLIILIMMFLIPGIDSYSHVCGLIIGIITGRFIM